MTKVKEPMADISQSDIWNLVLIFLKAFQIVKTLVSISRVIDVLGSVITIMEQDVGKEFLAEFLANASNLCNAR